MEGTGQSEDSCARIHERAPPPLSAEAQALLFEYYDSTDTHLAVRANRVGYFDDDGGWNAPLLEEHLSGLRRENTSRRKLSKQELGNRRRIRRLRISNCLPAAAAEEHRCPVCLEPVDKAMWLPCGHCMCAVCGSSWFKDHGNSCPVCRALVPSYRQPVGAGERRQSLQQSRSSDESFRNDQITSDGEVALGLQQEMNAEEAYALGDEEQDDMQFIQQYTSEADVMNDHQDHERRERLRREQAQELRAHRARRTRGARRMSLEGAAAAAQEEADAGAARVARAMRDIMSQTRQREASLWLALVQMVADLDYPARMGSRRGRRAPTTRNVHGYALRLHAQFLSAQWADLANAVASGSMNSVRGAEQYLYSRCRELGVMSS